MIIAAPLWAMTSVLLVVFGAVSYAARVFVLRRRDEDAREELADQARNLFTGIAATFAFFIGFTINVAWNTVSAAQSAVESQAIAVVQLDREIGNIPDRAESAALTDKLKTYVRTVVNEDRAFLVKGQATRLPSAGPLDDLENAVDAYVFGPKAPDRVVTPLSSGLSALETASATVSAIANRGVPRPLATLVAVIGLLVCVIAGIATVTYSRPSLAFLWCVIPALSITVVLAVAYPFAVRSGASLAPLQVVAENILSN